MPNYRSTDLSPKRIGSAASYLRRRGPQTEASLAAGIGASVKSMRTTLAGMRKRGQVSYTEPTKMYVWACTEGTPDVLWSDLTPEMRDLLHVLHQRGPTLVVELAGMVGRDQSAVREHALELQRYGYVSVAHEKNPAGGRDRLRVTLVADIAAPSAVDGPSTRSA